MLPPSGANIEFSTNKTESRPSHSFLSRSEWLDHAEGASTRFMVASGGDLSEGYGHDEPGVCLGDGPTETYLKDMGMATQSETRRHAAPAYASTPDLTKPKSLCIISVALG